MNSSRQLARSQPLKVMALWPKQVDWLAQTTLYQVSQAQTAGWVKRNNNKKKNPELVPARLASSLVQSSYILDVVGTSDRVVNKHASIAITVGLVTSRAFDFREVLQYVITCQNTYVICHRALRQVLVLQHFAALWLDVKPKYPGCGLAPSSKQRKVCASHPRVPKSKRWGSRLTTKRPRWEKNRLRRETVARPLVTWFTYQDNVENRGRASEATFVRFLRQDNVLQNLSRLCHLRDLLTINVRDKTAAWLVTVM